MTYPAFSSCARPAVAERTATKAGDIDLEVTEPPEQKKVFVLSPQDGAERS